MAERREQLLDAAVAVMRDGGLQGTSTRTVTQRAGLPHGAFHYCFASKDAMLLALLEREVEVALGGLWRVVLDLDDPAAGIEAAMLGYLDHVREDPAGQLAARELVLAVARRSLAEGADVRRRVVARSAEVLERWGAVHGLTWRLPVEAVAATLVMTATGLAESWLVTRDDELARASVRAAGIALGALCVPTVGSATAL